MTASRNQIRSSIIAMRLAMGLAMGLATGLAAMLAVPAAAQGAGSNDSDYSKEVQACLLQRPQHTREACLEDVRNARAAQGGGELGKGSGSVVATARCQSLSGEFRACETHVPAGADRVRIEPQTSNSVVVLVPSTTR